jgi:hypothetical protein
LLRQRTAALTDLTVTQVDQRCARDCREVEAVVTLEAPVFNGFQRVDEQWRYCVRLDQYPVFVMRREQAAEANRLEPDQRQHRLLSVADGGNKITVETDDHLQRRFQAVPVPERMRPEGHPFASDREFSGCRNLGNLLVTRLAKGAHKVLPGYGCSRVELHGRGVNVSREIPSTTLECGYHVGGQEKHIRAKNDQDDGRNKAPRRFAKKRLHASSEPGQPRGEL